jgi:hypothetical protein
VTAIWGQNPTALTSGSALGAGGVWGWAGRVLPVEVDGLDFAGGHHGCARPSCCDGMVRAEPAVEVGGSAHGSE